MNLILITMISVAVMARRHHHSDIERMAFRDIESMFKLMNDFSPMLPVEQEVQVVASVDTRVGGI